MRIFGVNEAGSESGNDFVEGTIPLLQDAPRGAWDRWRAVYRDVVVLDPQNRRITAFNLTDHDLRVQGEYDALKAILLDAVARSFPAR